MTRARLWVGAALLAMSACGGSTDQPGTDSGAVDSGTPEPEAGVHDTGVDSSHDAPHDASDAATDSMNAMDAADAPVALDASDGGVDSADGSDAADATDASDASDGGTVVAGGDISSSNLSPFEAETDLVVAPNGDVAAVWIGMTSATPFHIGYRFSTDFGAQWRPIAKIDGPAGRNLGDPTVAVDAQGNFWAAFIGFDVAGGQPTNMTIYIAEAPAGTFAFGTPVAVNDPADVTPSYDKPWITITAAGTIAVTWASFDANGNSTIHMATSSNGQMWSRSIVYSASGNRNLAMPCTAGTRLWVVFNADEGIALHWSDDQGATWPAANTTIVAAPGTLTFDDPSCVASGNDVWVEYEQTSNGGTAATGIFVAHSSNGGTSFGAPGSALDQTLAYHASVALESPGMLDLVYYAGVSDPDPAGSYRRTRSTDNGQTWSASAVIKSGQTFLTDRTMMNWNGDYVGAMWLGGSLYTTFTDNSAGGISHITFASSVVP